MSEKSEKESMKNLIRRYKCADGNEKEELLNEIVSKAEQKLEGYVIARAMKDPDPDKEELKEIIRQEYRVHLPDCLEKYDPERYDPESGRSAAFETYLVQCCKHDVDNAITEWKGTILPRHVLGKVRRVKKMMNELRMDLNSPGEDDIEKLCEKYNQNYCRDKSGKEEMTPEKMKDILDYMPLDQTGSLNDLVNSDTDSKTEKTDRLSDTKEESSLDAYLNRVEEARNDRLIEILAREVGGFAEKEKKVIELWLRDGRLTIEDIAEKTDQSREGVISCLHKIRKSCEKKYPEIRQDFPQQNYFEEQGISDGRTIVRSGFTDTVAKSVYAWPEKNMISFEDLFTNAGAASILEKMRQIPSYVYWIYYLDNAFPYLPQGMRTAQDLAAALWSADTGSAGAMAEDQAEMDWFSKQIYESFIENGVEERAKGVLDFSKTGLCEEEKETWTQADIRTCICDARISDEALYRLALGLRIEAEDFQAFVTKVQMRKVNFWSEKEFLVYLTCKYQYFERSFDFYQKVWNRYEDIRLGENSSDASSYKIDSTQTLKNNIDGRIQRITPVFVKSEEEEEKSLENLLKYHRRVCRSNCDHQSSPLSLAKEMITSLNDELACFYDTKKKPQSEKKNGVWYLNRYIPDGTIRVAYNMNTGLHIPEGTHFRQKGIIKNSEKEERYYDVYATEEHLIPPAKVEVKVRSEQQLWPGELNKDENTKFGSDVEFLSDITKKGGFRKGAAIGDKKYITGELSAWSDEEGIIQEGTRFRPEDNRDVVYLALEDIPCRKNKRVRIPVRCEEMIRQEIPGANRSFRCDDRDVIRISNPGKFVRTTEENRRYSEGILSIEYKKCREEMIRKGTRFVLEDPTDDMCPVYVAVEDTAPDFFVEKEVRVRGIERDTAGADSANTEKDAAEVVLANTEFTCDLESVVGARNKSRFKTGKGSKLTGSIYVRCKPGSVVPEGTVFRVRTEKEQHKYSEYAACESVDFQLEERIHVRAVRSYEYVLSDGSAEMIEPNAAVTAVVNSSVRAYPAEQSSRRYRDLFSLLYSEGEPGEPFELQKNLPVVQLLYELIADTQVNIDEIMSGKTVSVDRNTILTLASLLEMVEQSREEERASQNAREFFWTRLGDYQYQVDRALHSCGYHESYLNNPYDCLLCYLMLCDEPLLAFLYMWRNVLAYKNSMHSLKKAYPLVFADRIKEDGGNEEAYIIHAVDPEGKQEILSIEGSQADWDDIFLSLSKRGLEEMFFICTDISAAGHAARKVFPQAEEWKSENISESLGRCLGRTRSELMEELKKGCRLLSYDVDGVRKNWKLVNRLNWAAYAARKTFGYPIQQWGKMYEEINCAYTSAYKRSHLRAL